MWRQSRREHFAALCRLDVSGKPIDGSIRPIQPARLLRNISQLLNVATPEVCLAETSEEVEAWVETHVLSAAAADQPVVLGIDTEAKALALRDTVNTGLIALLQIAVATHVLLVRTYFHQDNGSPRQVTLRSMPKFCKILETDIALKVGFNMDKEIDDLREFDIKLGPVFNLSNITPGISTGAEDYLRLNYSKHCLLDIRVSDWEAPQLTEAHLDYAAADAWLSLKIYEARPMKLENAKAEKKRRPAAALPPPRPQAQESCQISLFQETTPWSAVDEVRMPSKKFRSYPEYWKGYEAFLIDPHSAEATDDMRHTIAQYLQREGSGRH